MRENREKNIHLALQMVGGSRDTQSLVFHSEMCLVQ